MAFKNEQVFSLSVSAGKLWFSWPRLGLTGQLSGHRSAGLLVCSPALFWVQSKGSETSTEKGRMQTAPLSLIVLVIFRGPDQRRQWHPTPVLLSGKSHGRGSLVGSMGLLRVGHDWATSLSIFTFMLWRGKWQPTPVFLPGESQGRGSLVGCCLWGRTESDTTEVT